MLDKTKIYCQGCSKLTYILEKIKQSKLAKIPGINYDSHPNYFWGYISFANEIYIIYYSCENVWKHFGYQKVTPEEFEEAWLGSNKMDLCCRGTKYLADAILQLEKDYDFDSNIPITKGLYYTFKKHDGKWYLTTYVNDSKEAETIQEFIDYWKDIIPKKKIEEYPLTSEECIKEEQIGFIGDVSVDLTKLPNYIDSAGFIGKSSSHIYFLNNNRLCTISTTNSASNDIKIVSFDEFIKRTMIKTKEEVIIRRPYIGFIGSENIDITRISDRFNKLRLTGKNSNTVYYIKDDILLACQRDSLAANDVLIVSFDKFLEVVNKDFIQEKITEPVLYVHSSPALIESKKKCPFESECQLSLPEQKSLKIVL